MRQSDGLDRSAAREFITERWAADLIPQLVDYVAIPALSPAFDPDWESNGHLRAAVDQIVSWLRTRPVVGLRRVEVRTLPGRTPLILVEIDPFGTPSTDATVILYGHLDKQPEMTGWRRGLGPWSPVIEAGRLYGRGGADDGYAAFASLTAIEAVQHAGGSHARCLLLIEASEESGSPDLPAHIEALSAELGAVDLVVCLDSGCLDYETLWLTTSLRGLAMGTVRVEVLTEGVHSGAASGVVPSSFRIMRQLLDRVEDAATGRVLLEAASVDVPPTRVREAEELVAAVGDRAVEPFPTVAGLELMGTSPVDAVLARTWRPTLSVVGVDGIPPVESAGNVLRPTTALKLSIRLPPTADHRAAVHELVRTVTADPPSNARVTVEHADSAGGWNAPELEPWLEAALHDASRSVFDRPMQRFGEGGSIPFMGMLGAMFPDSQFVITGVLGPESNAHGPNEFLDLAYAEKLTNCLGQVLHAHATRFDQGEHP